MRRKVNYKLWAGFIVGLFILSAFLSAQSSAEMQVKNKSNTEMLNAEWIPIVGHFRILGTPSGKVDIEISDTHFDILNWTGLNQQIQITWKIENIYDIDKIVYVGYRTREWQSGFFAKVLFFINDYGNVHTPTETGWINPQKLHVKPYTNASGNFTINIHFDFANPFTDMATFLWGWVPFQPITFNKDWSGQKVYFNSS